MNDRLVNASLLLNRVLNLSVTNVSSSDVEQLVLCCPLLEFIGLGHCPNDAAASLEHVAELRHLRAVDLRMTSKLVHGACVGLQRLLELPCLSAILLTEHQLDLRAFIKVWRPSVDVQVNASAEQFLSAYW